MKLFVRWQLRLLGHLLPIQLAKFLGSKPSSVYILQVMKLGTYKCPEIQTKKHDYCLNYCLFVFLKLEIGLFLKKVKVAVSL